LTHFVNTPFTLQSLKLLLHLFFKSIWNMSFFQEDGLCTFTDMNGGYIQLDVSIPFSNRVSYLARISSRAGT